MIIIMTIIAITQSRFESHLVKQFSIAAHKNNVKYSEKKYIKYSEHLYSNVSPFYSQCSSFNKLHEEEDVSFFAWLYLRFAYVNIHWETSYSVEKLTLRRQSCYICNCSEVAVEIAVTKNSVNFKSSSLLENVFTNRRPASSHLLKLYLRI